MEVLFQRIPEWFGLAGTLKTIQFQPSAMVRETLSTRPHCSKLYFAEWVLMHLPHLPQLGWMYPVALANSRVLRKTWVFLEHDMGTLSPDKTPDTHVNA